jgi:predicted Zn-dependent protease
MIFQAGLATGARLLIGAPEGAAEVLTGTTLDLTALRFGRDQEIAADRGGLRLLHKAALPGEGLSAFFDQLAAKEGALPPLLSTHPPARDRAARLEAEGARLGRWPVERPEIDWRALQEDARALR